MPNNVANEPPPLIQDPQDLIKPILLAKRSDKSQFDVTKVLAAVGLILTITIIIVGVLWITVQNLENRVNNLEADLSTVPNVQRSAASAEAKLATKAAEKTATQSGN